MIDSFVLTQMPIITAETPKTGQPFPVTADRLFPHQLSTLYELQRLERERVIAITPTEPVYDAIRGSWFSRSDAVADTIRLQTQIGVLSSPTGTGKTHPMVALAMTPFNGGQHIQKTVNINSHMTLIAEVKHDLDKNLPSTLIVVPKNIYAQWMRVIKQSGATYHGVYFRKDLNDLIALRTQPKKSPRENNFAQQAFPAIVLCKHTLYNELVIKMPYWSRVILDEADTITIPSSRRVQGGFTWLVTATAEHLHTHPHKGYWRDVTHSISMHILRALEIKIDEQYAVECLHGANIQRHHILCQGINNMREVTQFLPRRIQEMLAAGDYNAAVQELGGQSHSTQSLTDLIVKYFDIRIEQTRENISEAVRLGHKHDAFDQRLNDLVARKEQLTEQIQKVSGACAICHDESADISLVQCCFQVFCTECILSWMSMRAGQTCPYCKHDKPTVLKINAGAKQAKEESVPQQSPEELALSKEPRFNSYQTLPKLIDHVLKTDQQAKIIVVTSYNMQAFQAQLENNRYQFNTLNHVSHRRTVEEYNRGVSPIILLDAKYNGAGIDLEQTTDIIYMQQLPENLMKQTQGRALRLSRPINLALRIFHLDREQPVEEAEPIDRFIALKRLVPPVPPKVETPEILPDDEDSPPQTPIQPEAPKKMIQKPLIRLRKKEPAQINPESQIPDPPLPPVENEGETSNSSPDPTLTPSDTTSNESIEPVVAQPRPKPIIRIKKV